MTDYDVIETLLLTIKPPKNESGSIDRADIIMWANKAYEYGLNKKQWDRFINDHIKDYYATGGSPAFPVLIARGAYQGWIK